MLVWTGATMLHFQHYLRMERPVQRRSLIGTALGQLAGVSWLLAGALAMANGSAGLYRFIPAFLLSYLLALLNAWVLLVEINR